MWSLYEFTFCLVSPRQLHFDWSRIDGQMHTIQTNDIETYYKQRGDGPSIVFIHGALADHTAADQQLEAFSDAYTAIA